jgi:PAS domain S-box-containing protein
MAIDLTRLRKARALRRRAARQARGGRPGPGPDPLLAPRSLPLVQELERYRIELASQCQELEARKRELERSRADVEQWQAAFLEANARLELDQQEKRAEEETLQVVSMAVEQSPASVVITDAAGAIQYVNPACERVTGYSLAELMGANPRVLQSGQQEPAFYRAMWETLGAGRTWTGVFLNRRKDGSTFTENATISPVRDPQGRTTHYLAIKEDISELKRAVDQIQRLNDELEQRVQARTAQLEAANQELEAFSYSVSHDLRAPLRSIRGFSGILLETCQDRLDPTSQDYLRRVDLGARHMGGLIEDLLKLSQVSRGELDRTPLDLSAMARRILAELARSDPGRTVATRVDPDLRAIGDRRLVTLALDNLLRNAWKYTGKRAEARIEFGLDPANGEPVFQVRDNGAGFDMAHAGKLFGAFQRLHSSQDFEGTGIGLAITQRVVHRHGGRIWAHAEPDQGATFSFTLPDDRWPGSSGCQI